MRLYARHGKGGCTGAQGTTFYTAPDLCNVCWWNRLIAALGVAVPGDTQPQQED